MPANRKHHATDTAAAARWRLLGSLLRKRRVELGHRYRPAFAEAKLPRTRDGNLMIRALNAIENGERPGTYTEETMAMYARAYEVTEESVYAVLNGSADKLEPAAPPVTAAPPSAPPSALLREDADRPYFSSIWDRLLDLADHGISDPDGAQLGLAADDAKLWDGTRGAMSRGDRAWLLADIQRRRREARDKANGRPGASTA